MILMRLMGIDYGAKNVGVALATFGSSMAFPKCVLKNDKDLLDKIKEICIEEDVTIIVMGESHDFKGRANPIMKKISSFKKELENALRLPVEMEPEFMTSREAERLQGSSDKIDASAAAIILKSFLEKRKPDLNNY